MWLGDWQHGCCSGLSNTVRRGELPKHLCSGQLGSVQGEGLDVWQCGRDGSRQMHGEEQGVCAH